MAKRLMPQRKLSSEDDDAGPSTSSAGGGQPPPYKNPKMAQDIADMEISNSDVYVAIKQAVAAARTDRYALYNSHVFLTECDRWRLRVCREMSSDADRARAKAHDANLLKRRGALERFINAAEMLVHELKQDREFVQSCFCDQNLAVPEPRPTIVYNTQKYAYEFPKGNVLITGPK